MRNMFNSNQRQIHHHLHMLLLYFMYANNKRKQIISLICFVDFSWIPVHCNVRQYFDFDRQSLTSDGLKHFILFWIYNIKVFFLILLLTYRVSGGYWRYRRYFARRKSLMRKLQFFWIISRIKFKLKFGKYANGSYSYRNPKGIYIN